ncbi:MAG: DUF835 domain-containing protein [archaeon]
MLEKGKAYLLVSHSDNELCSNVKELAQNYESVLIVSRCPDDCRKKNTNYRQIWLTELDTTLEHIKPQNIEQICYEIEKFIVANKGRGNLVVIEGIEYLISYNAFKEIFHILNRLRDSALINNSILVVAIGNDTIPSHEENMLKQEFCTLSNKVKNPHNKILEV